MPIPMYISMNLVLYIWYSLSVGIGWVYCRPYSMHSAIFTAAHLSQQQGPVQEQPLKLDLVCFDLLKAVKFFWQMWTLQSPWLKQLKQPFCQANVPTRHIIHSSIHTFIPHASTQLQWHPGRAGGCMPGGFLGINMTMYIKNEQLRGAPVKGLTPLLTEQVIYHSQCYLSCVVIHLFSSCYYLLSTCYLQFMWIPKSDTAIASTSQHGPPNISASPASKCGLVIWGRRLTLLCLSSFAWCRNQVFLKVCCLACHRPMLYAC